MENEQDQPQDRATGFLSRLAASETIWLAGIPVIAYLTVFSYYSGYFSVFSLPRQLIEFNLVEVFAVSGVILGIAFMAFFWGDLAISAVSELPDILAFRLRRGILIFFIFLGISIVILSPANLRSFHWFALAGIVLVIATEVVFPLLTQRNEEGYLNKLRAAEVRREKVLKDETLQTPVEKLMILMGPWLGAAVLLLFFVYGIGKFQAVTRKSFYISSESPSTVVL